MGFSGDNVDTLGPIGFLSTVTLYNGSHTPSDGRMCAEEALACALGLPWSDCPPCTDRPLARAFQRVNDWNGWASDEERSEFIRPFLMRQGRLALAGKHCDGKHYAFAAADLACRVFAPAAMDAAGLKAEADTMRTLPAVVNRDTANVAQAACRNSRRSAAYAYAADAADAYAYAADAYAYAYAYADAYAYAADAYAAAYADAAAAAAADAAAAYAYADAYADAAAAAAAAARKDAYKTHASALLTRLLDVCEAGVWPLPVDSAAEVRPAKES